VGVGPDEPGVGQPAHMEGGAACCESAAVPVDTEEVAGGIRGCVFEEGFAGATSNFEGCRRRRCRCFGRARMEGGRKVERRVVGEGEAVLWPECS